MASIEVRLLGPLVVRRGDGSLVGAAEWKTTKTLDLLRLLALNIDRPMTVPAVIDRLWPHVDRDRGRASLRTAASQLRKILDVDCVERRAGALVLTGVWVDTAAYTELVHEVELARRAGDPERVVALARRAEALYVGDIDVTTGDWDGDASHWFREQRQRILLDGAAAAAGCGWMRDSLDLASRAREVELTEEVARALMRAHAGLGETDRALEVYDTLRHDLAERLGVDPAAQTRALHMFVLRGTNAVHPSHGPVGVEGAVCGVVRAARMLLERGPSRGVVWLCGPEGSGRTTVAALAANELGLPLHDLTSLPFESYASCLLSEGAGGHRPGLLVLSTRQLPPAWAVPIVRDLAERYAGVVVVRSTAFPEAELPAEGQTGAVAADAAVQMGPLTASGLTTLAATLLQGEPSADLLRRLQEESGGLAGAACGVLRGWLDDGLVVWREDGLALARPREETAGDQPVEMFRTALRTLGATELDVLSALALSALPLTRAAIADVLRHPAELDQAVLDRLVDHGFVIETTIGYQVARESVAQEVAGWIRPTVRRRLDSRIPLRAPIPPRPA